MKFDCDSPEPLRRNEGITCPSIYVWTEPSAHYPYPFWVGVYSTMLKFEGKLAGAISRDPFIPTQWLRRITIKLHLQVKLVEFFYTTHKAFVYFKLLQQNAKTGLCPAFAHFDVIYYLYKMKQFHWLLCVAKNLILIGREKSVHCQA